jgi:hypothetical protein
MRELEREAELRRVREAQPPTQTIGGGTPAPALPVSTPAASSSEEAPSGDPLPPAPGTVATGAPNAFAARDLPEPKQGQFEARELPQGAQVDQPPAAKEPAAAESGPDSEKVSDGRTRPA